MANEFKIKSGLLLGNPAISQPVLLITNSSDFGNLDVVDSSALATVEAIKNYVDVNGGTTGNYLPLTGGTLTGNLTIEKDFPAIFLHDNSGIDQIKWETYAENGTYNLRSYDPGTNGLISNPLEIDNSTLTLKGDTDGWYINNEQILTNSTKYGKYLSWDHTAGTITLKNQDNTSLSSINITNISGVNADTVDGYHASQLAKLAEDETITGHWTYNENITIYDSQVFTIDNDSSQATGLTYGSFIFYKDISAYNLMKFGFAMATANVDDYWYVNSHDENGNWEGNYIRIYRKSKELRLHPTTGLTWDGHRVLTTLDEGSGNGLDADTVDNLHASQFLRSDANDTANGVLTFNANTYHLGNVAIGKTSADAKLDVYESITLGSTATNYRLLTKVSGKVSNLFTENTWLYRDNNGSDWVTARLHNGISIDTSYTTPHNSDKTWWERDPNGNIQEWGNENNTYMSLYSDYLQLHKGLKLGKQFSSSANNPAWIKIGRFNLSSQYANTFTKFEFASRYGYNGILEVNLERNSTEIFLRKFVVYGNVPNMTFELYKIDNNNWDLYLKSTYAYNAIGIGVLRNGNNFIWDSTTTALTTQPTGTMTPLKSEAGLTTSNDFLIKATDGGAILQLDYPNAITGYIRGSRNGSNKWYLGNGGTNDDLNFMNYSNANLKLGTNSGTKMTIDGNGSVGIGTDSPSYKFHVQGNGYFSSDLQVGGTTINENIVIRALSNNSYKSGFEAYGNSQGTGYLYVGQSTTYGGGIIYNGDDNPDLPFTVDRISFYRRSSGNDYEVFNYSNGANDVYFMGTLRGPNGNASSPTFSFSGDTNTGFYTNSQGRINVSTDGTERFRFDVSTFHAAGDIIAFSTSVSDVRLKENIQRLDSSIFDIISKLNPVIFNMKDTGELHSGFIAQEIEEYIPHLIKESELLGKEGIYKTLRYTEIIPYNTKAIQDLYKKIDKQDKEIKDLKEKLELVLRKLNL